MAGGGDNRVQTGDGKAKAVSFGVKLLVVEMSKSGVAVVLTAGNAKTFGNMLAEELGRR